MNKKAFTLVELIVVITILAILATVWFISFQGHAQSARDSVRLSDLKSIEKQLSIFVLKNSKYPMPDDAVEITASGTLINYQWYAGARMLWTIWVHGWGQDPLDGTYYTYTTNSTLTKYQLLWYLEGVEEVAMLGNDVHAWLEDRYPMLRWSDLGILVDPITKEPVQNTGMWVDVVNTGNWYTLYLNNDNLEINGTGSLLSLKLDFRINETWSCNAIFKNEKSNWDWVYKINPTWNSEFDVYCDMTTDWAGWTMVGYYNHWWLSYSSWALWNKEIYNIPWWKLSDSITNNIFNNHLKLEWVWKLWSEYFYCKNWIFDYSWQTKANNKTICSRKYNYIYNWYVWNRSYNKWYPVSHRSAKDVWLRNNYNGGTRWQSIDWNPAWYQYWHLVDWNSASPDIKMRVK
jgi:prepilin-type N-terminal cleavage/methylation domain-containing protein